MESLWEWWHTILPWWSYSLVCSINAVVFVEHADIKIALKCTNILYFYIWETWIKLSWGHQSSCLILVHVPVDAVATIYPIPSLHIHIAPSKVSYKIMPVLDRVLSVCMFTCPRLASSSVVFVMLQIWIHVRTSVKYQRENCAPFDHGQPHTFV